MFEPLTYLADLADFICPCLYVRCRQRAGKGEEEQIKGKNGHALNYYSHNQNLKIVTLRKKMHVVAGW